jgi:hypothetical protein
VATASSGMANPRACMAAASEASDVARIVGDAKDHDVR